MKCHEVPALILPGSFLKMHYSSLCFYLMLYNIPLNSTPTLHTLKDRSQVKLYLGTSVCPWVHLFIMFCSVQVQLYIDCWPLKMNRLNTPYLQFKNTEHFKIWNISEHQPDFFLNFLPKEIKSQTIFHAQTLFHEQNLKHCINLGYVYKVCMKRWMNFCV